MKPARRKKTLQDYALWAALPMAQTSRIEGRLEMILDKTRTRSLNRRFFYAAAALSLLGLVTVAVLQPVAKAQTSIPTAPAEALSTADVQHIGLIAVRLTGVTATAKAGSPWWSASGAPQPVPVYDTASYRAGRGVSSAGMKIVTFAFQIPADLSQDTVSFEVAGGSSFASTGSSSGEWALTAPFPPEQKTATVRVGIASGAWTRAASDLSPTLGMRTTNSGNTFAFSPVTKINHDSVVTITTNQIKDALKFVAINQEGQEQWPSSMETTGLLSTQRRTMHFHLPPSQIKEFRVETRPFQWAEFKDVALQPVQPAQSVSTLNSSSLQPQGVMPWNSETDYVNWKAAKTYRLTERIQPSISGTRPEPPVGGQLVSGPGKVANFVITPWKPGKSNILTVQYDYTPKITDKVHPDVIDLLTKDETIATVITQQPTKPGPVTADTVNGRTL